MHRANIVVSVVAFFTIFFIFCGFAIDFSMIIATRAKLQSAAENAVLASVEKISEGTAEQTAQNIFMYSKIHSAKFASIEEIETKPLNNAIAIKASAPAQTYFLSALGLSNIELKAQASAQIKSYETPQDADFSLENHLQYTFPILVTNKNGAELEIDRVNADSAYRTFIGLKGKTSDIKWAEITCAVENIGEKEQTFDFDAPCIRENYEGGISAAKYLRIINSNAAVPLEIEKVNIKNTAKLISYSDFKSL